MKFPKPVHFGVAALALLLATLLIGPTASVRSQDGGPVAGDAAADQLQAPAVTLGTSFSYQGRLNDGGNPANGAYDLQFKLFDAASGGTQIGSTASKNDLPVSGGLFTADLDFGAGAFDGQARWLEVAVRPGASTGAYTTLALRRALLASPYATYSSNMRGLAVASNGNVGIGANDPTAHLEIVRGPLWTTSNWRKAIKLQGSESAIQFDTGRSVKFGLGGSSNGPLGGLQFFTTTAEDNSQPPQYPLSIWENGNIGVGTNDPTAHLEIVRGPLWTTSNWRKAIKLQGSESAIQFDTGRSVKFGLGGSNNGGSLAGLYFFTTTAEDGSQPPQYPLSILENGNIGVGTNDPKAKLDVAGDISLPSQNLLVHRPDDRFAYDGKSMGHYSLGWFGDSWNSQGATAWLSGFAGVKFFSGGAPRQVITADGRVGIGTTSPQAKLDIAGTTRTDVLQIDAGADLAERFEVTGDAAPAPGAVVIVDEEHPGQLTVSQQACDTRVIGVISGAGGIQPGLTLHQEGLLDGNTQVAIAGRVYVKAEAISGPIKPGDMLTTSDVPGHVMKASDRDRAFGAVVGKALTGLTEGTGLVLVLVNLQ